MPSSPCPTPDRIRIAPVQRAGTLGDQACHSLRAALRQGALAPGERLTTRRVAATLGVSLTPAREALNRLAAEQVLEMGEDRSITVPLLTRARYREILAIRLELEGLAAREACTALAAPASMARLRSLYDAHEAAFLARDPAGSLRHNEDFHFTIYAAAGMKLLLRMIESLWLQVGPTMRLLFPASFEAGWIGRTTHTEMLEAITARDPARLEAAVRRDLLDGQARLEHGLWPDEEAA